MSIYRIMVMVIIIKNLTNTCYNSDVDNDIIISIFILFIMMTIIII